MVGQALFVFIGVLNLIDEIDRMIWVKTTKKLYNFTSIIRLIAVIVFTAWCISCTKYQPVEKVSQDFIGTWVTRIDEDHFIQLNIQSNGRGTIYSKEPDGVNKDTQRRQWFIQNDVLHFSRFFNGDEHENFHIENYPTKATDTLVSGSTTILPGQWYMTLDGLYFLKNEDP